MPPAEPANEADAAATADLMTPRGAYVMGRNMFGPVRGPWSSFGQRVARLVGRGAAVRRAGVRADPPRPRAARDGGGTTFHFVTDGFDAAYARAVETAAGGDVRITGGASTVRQAFAAGVLDEITLDVAPVLLGAGERLFEGVADPGLELLEVTSSPLVTHLRYRVGR